MADDDAVPGSGSCIRCRGPMPIGAILCPTCSPTSPEPVRLGASPTPGTTPTPSSGRPESLVNSPFVVALALTIMFLVLASYHPRDLAKERGEPLSMKSEVAGQEAEELKAWSEEMRRRYIDPYTGNPTLEVTPDQLRAVLEAQMEKIDSDPHLTPEQRRQVRVMIDKALGAAGK